MRMQVVTPLVTSAHSFVHVYRIAEGQDIAPPTMLNPLCPSPGNTDECTEVTTATPPRLLFSWSWWRMPFPAPAHAAPKSATLGLGRRSLKPTKGEQRTEHPTAMTDDELLEMIDDWENLSPENRDVFAALSRHGTASDQHLAITRPNPPAPATTQEPTRTKGQSFASFANQTTKENKHDHQYR